MRDTRDIVAEKANHHHHHVEDTGEHRSGLLSDPHHDYDSSSYDCFSMYNSTPRRKEQHQWAEPEQQDNH
jgi:hypothetical protein